MECTVYNSDEDSERPGEILGHIECSTDTFSLQEENQLPNIGMYAPYDDVTKAYDTETHYHDLINTMRLRPVMQPEVTQTTILASSSDEVAIDNLPFPCTITVDDQVTEMDDPDDTVFEWSTALAGTYEILIEAWPYRPFTLNVEAV